MWFFFLLVWEAIIIVTCQKKPKAGKMFDSHGYLYEHSTDGQLYDCATLFSFLFPTVQIQLLFCFDQMLLVQVMI